METLEDFRRTMQKIDAAALAQGVKVRLPERMDIQIVKPNRGIMQEAENTDLWQYPADVRVITTNGTIRKDGKCVMGAGCAKEAKLRYPGIDTLLGNDIITNGNRVQVIWQEPTIVAFPVKHHFYQKADLTLIRESACQLVQLADRMNWKAVVMPRPGCGNGGRWWLAEVRPILIDILDGRFTVVHNGKPTQQGPLPIYTTE